MVQALLRRTGHRTRGEEGEERRAQATRRAMPEGQARIGGGRLKPIAASILMQTPYVARMARYDLLRPTCRLACYVSKWSDACDRRLFQLIKYVHSTYHLRQVGWVGDGLSDLGTSLTPMPDLAGDADTQRSTSGVHLAVRGPRTSFPILWNLESGKVVRPVRHQKPRLVCGHFRASKACFCPH
jgi:hypothetical protein